MRNPVLKSNITIISIFAATFLIPFLTSFLLDIEIIKGSLIRYIIIMILIIVQFILGVLLLFNQINK